MCLILPIDYTKQNYCEIDSEQLLYRVRCRCRRVARDRTYTVGIGEEANTRHYRKSNMIPAKRCFVDFGESHAASFVGVGDVGLFY